MPEPQKVEIDELIHGEYYFIECYVPGYGNSQGMLIGKFEKKLDNLNTIPGTQRGIHFTHGPYAEFSEIKIKKTPLRTQHETKYFAVYQPNSGGYKFYTIPSEQIRRESAQISSKGGIEVPAEISQDIMRYAALPPTSPFIRRKYSIGGRSRRKHKRKTNKKRKNVTHKRKSRRKGVKRRYKMS
tara:strand:- start:841 stop:1392 length:552 start_codon:yes stop_codon:yes gene_type:complete